MIKVINFFVQLRLQNFFYYKLFFFKFRLRGQAASRRSAPAPQRPKRIILFGISFLRCALEFAKLGTRLSGLGRPHAGRRLLRVGTIYRFSFGRGLLFFSKLRFIAVGGLTVAPFSGLAVGSFLAFWLSGSSLYASVGSYMDHARAMSAYEKQDFAASRSLLERVVKGERNDAQALFNLGAAYYREKEYEKAAGCFERLMQDEVVDNTIREQAAFNYGNVLVAQQKLSESLTAYEAALQLNPSNERAKHNHAIVQEMLKEQEKKQQQDKQQKDQDKQDNKKQQNDSGDKSEQDKQQNRDQQKKQDDAKDHNQDQQRDSGDQQDKQQDRDQQKQDKGKQGNGQDKQDNQQNNSDDKEAGDKDQNKRDNQKQQQDAEQQSDDKKDNEGQSRKQRQSSDQQQQQNNKQRPNGQSRQKKSEQQVDDKKSGTDTSSQRGSSGDAAAELDGVESVDPANALDAPLQEALAKAEKQDNAAYKRMIKMQVKKEMPGNNGQKNW